jgi:hypothetical protein
MWIGLVAGWIIGSAALYAYLIASAREPQNPECMDCRLLDCSDCTYLEEQRKTYKRAA